MTRLKPLLMNLLRYGDRIPLRTVLIVPFVVQIVAAVGLTGYFSYLNGQRAVSDLVSDLQHEISRRIQEKLTSYLTIPEIVNRINVDAVRAETLDLNDINSLEPHFWQQFQQFSAADTRPSSESLRHSSNGLTLIAIGSERGNYIELGYEGETLTLRIRNMSRDYLTRSWGLSDWGSRLQLTRTASDYDPRQRPWYQTAAEVGKLVWVDPYIARFNQELFISANQPLFDRRGNFVGVTNVTLSLTDVGEFLSSLEVGDNGQTFIIEQNGLLVATSTEQSLFLQKQEPERISSINSEDPLTRAVAQYLNQQYGSFSGVPIEKLLRFRNPENGQRYFVRVDPTDRQGRGLNWLVVSVIPEADFMEEINSNTRTTLLLCLGALGLAILSGVVTSRWITRPILQLSQAANALSSGDWEQEVSCVRNDELGTLATAFQRMREQLKQSHQDLESYSRQLEQKVEERTREVQESEEKFSKAFRSSPEPIAIASFSDGRILEVNDSFLQLTGYPLAEVLQKTAAELNLWANSEDESEVVRLLNDTGMVRNLEVNCHTRSDEIRTLLLSAEIIELNQQPCVLFVLSDISDRKQTEAELEKAKEAAEVANHAKSAFLANMSHELRTPLNAILGFSQLIARNPVYASASKEVEIITRSGEHLLALINDILDMSKIEAGQITLTPTSFDLYSLLDTLEDMLRLRAPTKSLYLRFERSADLPQYIHTDEKKLRQVLINLLGNALKFTDSGHVRLRVGRENVRSSPAPVPDAPPDAPSEQTQLLFFEVEDTGCGIAPDEIEQLFNPFVQTESGRRSQQGTGLGLSISRKFVQLMGGDITVTSVLGKGSRFRFTIWVEPAIAEEITPQKSARRVIGLAPDQPNYRILVVDEVPENRLLMRQLLEPIGFQVFEAEHGKTAIVQWEAHAPHLIWMDMRMPVMDGYEATRRIKQSAEAKQQSDSSNLEAPFPVIIALSASALDKDGASILASGCDDFVRKPFHEATIWAKMAEHLNIRYVYADRNDADSLALTSSNVELQPSDLAIMPSEWIAQLHAAAISGDDLQAIELLNQIPSHQNQLAHRLKHLLDDFRLDTISELTASLLPDRAAPVSTKSPL